MRSAEIVSYAQEQELFGKEMFSRTPEKSLQRALSLSILSEGENSRFIRTGPGVFFLRELLDNTAVSAPNALGLDEEIHPSEYMARRRLPAASSEYVLVIPDSHYAGILNFQGFKKLPASRVRALTKGASPYMARTLAEQSPSFKQVITYTLITCGSKVLSFRRGTFNRAAAFLKGSLCIGFGGHVTESDWDIFSHDDAGIKSNALREINEEIALPAGARRPNARNLKVVGIINDDSSQTGQQHVGVVLQYEVEDWASWSKAKGGEASINQVKWLDAADEINLIEFEYWSQLCWRHLFPVHVVQTQPSYKILRKKPFSSPHILVVVGGIGSGKSHATTYLKDNLGYLEVNSGRILASLLGLPPVPKTHRSIFQEKAWDFISRIDGPTRLAAALLEAANESGSARVIIDGVRQRTTLELIKANAVVSVATLFVYSPPDIAYSFYSKRENGGDVAEPSDFMRSLAAPVEREVRYLMQSADVVLYNWTGKENYARTLTNLAKELRLKKE